MLLFVWFLDLYHLSFRIMKDCGAKVTMDVNYVRYGLPLRVNYWREDYENTACLTRALHGVLSYVPLLREPYSTQPCIDLDGCCITLVGSSALLSLRKVERLKVSPMVKTGLKTERLRAGKIP